NSSYLQLEHEIVQIQVNVLQTLLDTKIVVGTVCAVISVGVSIFLLISKSNNSLFISIFPQISNFFVRTRIIILLII
ncbi:hypothetical protein, partial [Bacillus cereus]